MDVPTDKKMEPPGNDEEEKTEMTEIFRQEFSVRLNRALEHAGHPGRGGQTWLAQAMGVSQTNSRKWLKGVALPEIQKIVALAKLLGVRLEWLISGSGDMVREEIAHWVPVIALGSIPAWLDQALRQNVRILTTIPFPESLGPGSFAFPMQGSSMEPDFMDGEFVVVDPGAKWEHRSFVLSSGEPGTETVRRVVMDGGRPVLMVSNMSYPRIDTERSRILGTVSGKIRTFERSGK